jgi:hypothetical protein
MNSWDKSDTKIRNIIDLETDDCIGFDYRIGENDHDLMMNLAKAGRSHSKYRRMVNVTCDINAPLYWWKEYDTYKVGTVANSCSTMHKIQAKEFTLDDFSHEHLDRDLLLGLAVNEERREDDLAITAGSWLEVTISMLNCYRTEYLKTHDKHWWWQMIQLLPSSYNQLRTVQLNYEVLANMYHDRKNHKLDEWREFCKWIESLPYSEIIIGEKE